SEHELLSALLGKPEKSTHEIVQAYWKEQIGGSDFESSWKRALHDGVVPKTQSPSKEVKAKNSFRDNFNGQPTRHGLEIAFRPDPTIGDGRFANNAWLQELPKPFSKLTWDNAALISPATADELQIANEDLISIGVDGRSVEIPVWIVPGHPVGSITVHFGNGR